MFSFSTLQFDQRFSFLSFAVRSNFLSAISFVKQLSRKLWFLHFLIFHFLISIRSINCNSYHVRFIYILLWYIVVCMCAWYSDKLNPWLVIGIMAQEPTNPLFKEIVETLSLFLSRVTETINQTLHTIISLACASTPNNRIFPFDRTRISGCCLLRCWFYDFFLSFSRFDVDHYLVKDFMSSSPWEKCRLVAIFRMLLNQ